MGLVPEFFMVLGVFIFLAMSFLSAVLDDDLPSILPYLFQGAAAVGLGLLVMNQTFINGGILSRDPTDPTRFSINVVYLAFAVSIMASLNVYLAIVRRKMALSSILSGAMTLPTFTVSAILVSSFLGTGGGEVSFSPATVLILAVSAYSGSYVRRTSTSETHPVDADHCQLVWGPRLLPTKNGRSLRGKRRNP